MKARLLRIAQFAGLLLITVGYLSGCSRSPAPDETPTSAPKSGEAHHHEHDGACDHDHGHDHDQGRDQDHDHAAEKADKTEDSAKEQPGVGDAATSTDGADATE